MPQVSNLSWFYSSFLFLILFIFLMFQINYSFFLVSKKIQDLKFYNFKFSFMI